MIVNFIDVKSFIKKQSTAEELMKSCDKHLKGCKDSTTRYDIICSIFINRRGLRLKNKELVSFIGKFLPKVYCVYKLYAGEDIVYVGSSYAISTRIHTHQKDKDFDKVVVCIKNTKEEMLNLENAMIDKLKPVYNKSSNLKRSRSYGGDIGQETFICLDTHLTEIPVKRHINGNLYSLFSEDRLLYPYEALNSNGKHKIPYYMIQTSNDKVRSINKIKQIKYNFEKVTLQISIKDQLIKEGMEKYLVEDCPSFNLSTFDNTYLFTKSGKWRLVGKSKWYDSSIDSLCGILLEHVGNKYGKDTVTKDKIFSFGKYKNKLVKDVVGTDPNYIEWAKGSLDESTLVQLGLITQEEVLPVFETVWDRLSKGTY